MKGYERALLAGGLTAVATFVGYEAIQDFEAAAAARARIQTLQEVSLESIHHDEIEQLREEIAPDVSRGIIDSATTLLLAASVTLQAEPLIIAGAEKVVYKTQRIRRFMADITD